MIGPFNQQKLFSWTQALTDTVTVSPDTVTVTYKDTDKNTDKDTDRDTVTETDTITDTKTQAKTQLVPSFCQKHLTFFSFACCLFSCQLPATKLRRSQKMKPVPSAFGKMLD